MRMPVFVDTDIGLGTAGAEIDDGAALVVLCNSPEVEVCGISLVYGNVPVDQAYKNVSCLLSLLGREDIPVAPGAARSLVFDQAWSDKQAAGHAAKLLPDPDWHIKPGEMLAADLLIKTIRSAPGEITVLAIGPLTNLAIALDRAPDIEKSVRQIIAMGGMFAGTAPFSTEFNIRNDPEAAQRVLQASWPVRLLGLEITRQVLFSRADFNSLDSARPELALLREQALQWIPRVEKMGWESGGCCLHDAIAAATLLDENLTEDIEVGLDVITEPGDLRGVTVISTEDSLSAAGRKTVAVALHAIRCHDLIMERLGRKK